MYQIVFFPGRTVGYFSRSIVLVIYWEPRPPAPQQISTPITFFYLHACASFQVSLPNNRFFGGILLGSFLGRGDTQQLGSRHHQAAID